ncbi:MAG: tetratricopeptide repeat protein [bacterium]
MKNNPLSLATLWNTEFEVAHSLGGTDKHERSAHTRTSGKLQHLGLLIVGLGWMGITMLSSSCAPVPPSEERPAGLVVEEPADTLKPEERDSITAVRRSFANERWKNKDFVTAVEHFYAVRHYDIHHKHNIYRLWADCYHQLGKPDSALWAYEEGIKYFPQDDYLRYSVAIVYRNRGRISEAIEQALSAIEIKRRQIAETTSSEERTRYQTDLDRYLTDLESLYEMGEDWDKAIKVLEELVNRHPHDQDLRRRLTDIVRARRSPEEYLAQLREHLERFPDDQSTRFSYAQELYQHAYYTESARQWEIYLKAQSDPSGWRGLAKARRATGDLKGAIAALQKIISLEEYPADMVDIGTLYTELEDWASARQWLARALVKESSYGPALVAMGDLYFRCAERYSSNPPNFNDKLVYAIAYGLYLRAGGHPDPTISSEGARGKRNLENNELIPTKEDRFMNRKITRPTGKGYEWIDPEWSEVKFLDQFLKGLD